VSKDKKTANEVTFAQMAMYLIRQCPGASINIPNVEIARWDVEDPTWSLEVQAEGDDYTRYSVRQIPDGEPEELMGEAAGLLAAFLHNDDELDRAELDRALWLLSRGRRGDPRHDEYPH
jgi:hypothetical protein